MKKLFTILLSCSSLIIGFSQTIYTSTGSGNWSDSTVFSVSGSGSDVYYVISSGDVVTVDVASTVPLEFVSIYGTLEFDNGRKLTMTGSATAQVFTGGEVLGGNGGSKFTFPSGTDVAGPFNVTLESYATANTFGQFIAGILPVTWLNFTSVKTATHVHISWQTASESNTRNFVIQASTNGRTWNDLATLSAAGNSNITSNYAYDVATPTAGTHFYRIRQTDLDGSFNFSEIRFVMIQGTSTLSFSPNPATTDVTVNAGTGNSLEQVQIYSATGQKVVQPYSFLGNSIDISLMPKGIYLVQVAISNGENHTLRVIRD